MKKFIPVLIVFVQVFTGCVTDKQKDDYKQVITVSILPQKYFIDQLSGEHFNVNVMVPDGASPVTYEPSPRQISNMEKSLAYLKVGHLVFEKVWMDKFTSVNPDLKIFDQSEGVSLIKSQHDTKRRSSKHHAKGTDPHIWLSPKSVKVQIKNIRDMLIELYPEHKEKYRKNYQTFIAKVDSLDEHIALDLRGLKKREFLIFHPALSYFARDYHLKQIPVEHEGKEPTPARIRDLVNQAKQKNISAVFIQEQFSTDEARVLAREIDAAVVRIDPLSYDWMNTMHTITAKISASLEDRSN